MKVTGGAGEEIAENGRVVIRSTACGRGSDHGRGDLNDGGRGDLGDNGRGDESETAVSEPERVTDEAGLSLRGNKHSKDGKLR